MACDVSPVAMFFHVLHVLYVAHVLQTYFLFSHPGWQDGTISAALRMIDCNHWIPIYILKGFNLRYWSQMPALKRLQMCNCAISNTFHCCCECMAATNYNTGQLLVCHDINLNKIIREERSPWIHILLRRALKIHFRKKLGIWPNQQTPPRKLGRQKKKKSLMFILHFRLF